MKALVLFESAYGNTERIAREIAARLGTYGNVTLLHASEAGSANIYEYDLLVLGSPTQFRKASPTLMRWLDSLSYQGLKDMAVAVYDTRYQMPVWRSGSAGKLLAKRVRRLKGSLVIEAESFIVGKNAGDLLPGELERVDAWVDRLSLKLQGLSLP